MAALDVGVYDNFASDTLQSEMSDLRVLDDNEVELVNGQLGLAAGVALGVGIIVVAGVVAFGVGFWINRDPPLEPPPRPPTIPVSNKGWVNPHSVFPRTGY